MRIILTQLAIKRRMVSHFTQCQLLHYLGKANQAKCELKYIKYMKKHP